MADLDFKIQGCEPVLYGAAPMLAFKLQLTNAPADEALHTVALRAQIQIEAAQRTYTRQEQEALLDLFGERSRWGQTVRTMLWTHVSMIVPAFKERTVIDLQVPCSFDFNVAATKYFHGLSGGDLPLRFLFGGTIFYENQFGALQIAPVSWEKEAAFRLPVQTWRDLIETYYPNSAWLAIRKDIFNRLHHYKMRGGFATWEKTLEHALDAVEEPAHS